MSVWDIANGYILRQLIWSKNQAIRRGARRLTGIGRKKVGIQAGNENTGLTQTLKSISAFYILVQVMITGAYEKSK